MVLGAGTGHRDIPRPPRVPGGPGASHPLAAGDAESCLSLPQRANQMALGRLRGHGHVCWGPCATPGWSDPPGSASLVARGDLASTAQQAPPHRQQFSTSQAASHRLLQPLPCRPYGSGARNTSRATAGCSRGSSPCPGHPSRPEVGVPHCWGLVQAATISGQGGGTPGSTHPPPPRHGGTAVGVRVWDRGVQPGPTLLHSPQTGPRADRHEERATGWGSSLPPLGTTPAAPLQHTGTRARGRLGKS